MIVNRLHLDVSPWTLVENPRQARKCLKKQEKRPIQLRGLAKFNSQFYKTVERGVFLKLSLQEMAEYAWALNYVAIVEALKNGFHTITPLQICMNSSMKQLPPSRKWPNDCMKKGPSALVDLFKVTLGLREFQYALTKDLLKFYQRVQADEMALHLRRVIWRSGELERDLGMYVITTVNLGGPASQLHCHHYHIREGQEIWMMMMMMPPGFSPSGPMWLMPRWRRQQGATVQSF